ncbi:MULTISPECIES: hypothetical protein [unclassified Mesorhizobium]|uniref:hypothetical protein n=1 Tax=unclassified Mesorhizobium TaxID=325217 RepID=UPI000F75598A|nr:MULTISPECIES: hypothetical protein [unclassified Mesorhizobium]AZO51270.1 hypothetical protein EJ073_28760 [Mesorhizobium sp. M4B.F.Ca.ET.058.02.1.1]RVC43686.1 hypothetical protein EN781_17200 [Mesorhizobium sp. M4A.F.Ca.ET.090.04.2.1]
MPNNRVRAAAEGLPTINRRAALVMSGSGLAATLLGVSISAANASPAPAVGKLSGLEATFFVEWTKLRAIEPEHAAAERQYFEERAKLVKPVRRELTATEVEAFRKMTVAELSDWRHPGRIEFDEPIRAYNKAEWAIRRQTGFTKIDRAYQRQHSRVSVAAGRVIRYPAQTFEDIATKARVHKAWGFDCSDLECVMKDIARIARGGGLSVG